MRATRALVASAVVALAGLTVFGGGAERDRVGADDRLLAAAAGEERDGWLDGFDGRLYADDETGCIERWPGERGDDVRREDVDAPPPLPQDHIVRLQEPPEGARPDGRDPDALPEAPSPEAPSPEAPSEAPPPELAPPTLRGPWPLCEQPSVRVTDRLSDP
jgi:hypothetical protein